MPPHLGHEFYWPVYEAAAAAGSGSCSTGWTATTCRMPTSRRFWRPTPSDSSGC